MTTTPTRRRRWLSCLAITLFTWASAVGAEAQDVGEAVVSPREGGSSTQFRVQLPEGAECPGDSADDGYRVNSYMVPAAVDVVALPYDGLGPTPPDFGTYDTFREPLFDIDTNSYVSAQTADAEVPGEPGTIINLPVFSFAAYAPGDVPPGRYHIGIACTLDNEVVTIWDNQIEVTEAVDDQPAGIRWEVVGTTAASSGSGGGPVFAGLALVAVGLLVFFTRRRSQPRRPVSASMEDR